MNFMKKDFAGLQDNHMLDLFFWLRRNEILSLTTLQLLLVLKNDFFVFINRKNFCIDYLG